jgi:hypothetical protein
VTLQFRNAFGARFNALRLLLQTYIQASPTTEVSEKLPNVQGFPGSLHFTFHKVFHIEYQGSEDYCRRGSLETTRIIVF